MEVKGHRWKPMDLGSSPSSSSLVAKLSSIMVAPWGPVSMYAHLCELVIPKCTFLEGHEMKGRGFVPVCWLGASADGGLLIFFLLRLNRNELKAHSHKRY